MSNQDLGDEGNTLLDDNRGRPRSTHEPGRPKFIEPKAAPAPPDGHPEPRSILTSDDLPGPTNSPKYGRVTTSEKDIPVDEPVFLLRGKDTLASAAVRFYATLCSSVGRVEDAKAAHAVASAMEICPGRHYPR